MKLMTEAVISAKEKAVINIGGRSTNIAPIY